MKTNFNYEHLIPGYILLGRLKYKTFIQRLKHETFIQLSVVPLTPKQTFLHQIKVTKTSIFFGSPTVSNGLRPKF